MEASSSNGSEIPNNLGPDELCLKPMKSYPGFSQLCNLCIQVFREREKHKWKAHVQLLSTLEESAKRGCRLCNLISECFREYVQGKAITRLSLKYSVGNIGLELESESLSMHSPCYITCDPTKGKSQ